MEVELSSRGPEFLVLNVDGLGHSKRGANIFQAAAVMAGYKAKSRSGSSAGTVVEYRAAGQSEQTPPAWSVTLRDRTIELVSLWSATSVSEPIVFRFDLSKCHSTVLGELRADKTLSVPALMHLPGQGSVRITAETKDGPGLGYFSKRRDTLATLTFPCTPGTCRAWCTRLSDGDLP